MLGIETFNTIPKKFGNTQKVRILTTDDSIYTTGKVCSKCKNTATRDCSNLGGLCVTPPSP
ncbi:hypothetical protein ANCCAN_05369 [Ancylostoma caninum]|uniref:Uncharacterized protein n=1 Tax=Ancylostoma caninum TaxID=29170 RepID=A0A368GW43_ANCCA|nr:hypothetical protein ANCCAN_05369 [Ancylostoma caninum]